MDLLAPRLCAFDQQGDSPTQAISAGVHMAFCQAPVMTAKAGRSQPTLAKGCSCGGSPRWLEMIGHLVAQSPTPLVPRTASDAHRKGSPGTKSFILIYHHMHTWRQAVASQGNAAVWSMSLFLAVFLGPG
mmetsp:Transcript_123472/g.214118  ORF Transcript_123472/g.214118 Transcript_123472/m.214118 type:complete len:130 (+) Transcript_123472:1878-2267(+)